MKDQSSGRTQARTGHGPSVHHRAASSEDVQRIVADARRRRAQLSVSSSRNAVCGPGCEALDLSAMNAILAHDEHDLVAILQAGVTFGQAVPALQAQGMRLPTPLCPRADKSVIAAFLDREPTLDVRRHWDSTDPFGAGEMVLGTADLWRTGNVNPASFEAQWKAGHRFINSLGPAAVDFMRVTQGAQGGLGVVCWAAVTCAPVPTLETAHVLTSDSPDALARVAIGLARRRMGDIVTLGNDRLFAAMLSTNAAAAQALATQLQPWTLLVTLTGGTELPEEVHRCELQELERLAREQGLALVDTLGPHTAAELAAAARNPRADDFRNAVASEHRRVYFLSQLNKVSDLLRQVNGWIEAPAIHIQPRLQGRNCQVEFVLPTAKLGLGAEQAVTAFAEACAGAGGHFNRLAPAWEGIARRTTASLHGPLRLARNILDPDGVLNPRVAWQRWSDTPLEKAQ